MKTLVKTPLVEAALAGLFAAALVAPALAADAPAKKEPMPKKPMPMKKSRHMRHMKKHAETVHCFGINACKGQGQCAVEGKSGCKGMNACKGQGWVALTKKACLDKKGVVLGEKKPVKKPARHHRKA
ncbi:MAG: hypothetical protein KGM24_00820 [Elusimicrobia bacterium]|nr:hypothetical protein [Elusimicrobiota bacterium]